LVTLKDSIQDRSLRVLGVTEMEDPRVVTLLKGRGCLDVFSSKLIWNSLESNINYAIGILAMQRLLASTTPRSVSEPVAETAFCSQADDAPFDPDLEAKLKVWICSSDPADTRLVEASIVEYGTDNMLLDVGSKLCAEGQDVFLIMDDSNRKSENNKMKILVKLSAVIPTEADRQMVSIAIQGGLGAFLEPVQKAQQQLQLKILAYLKAARGW
jgi:hypothetical protein